MVKIVQLNDAKIRSLIAEKELWNVFPRFEQLNRKYEELPRQSGCNCRHNPDPRMQILNEAKNYLQSQPKEKKNQLKVYLNADYLRIGITDSTGRHKDYTW